MRRSSVGGARIWRQSDWEICVTRGCFVRRRALRFRSLWTKESIAYRAIELPKTTFFGLFRRENFAARSRARAAGHRQHKLGKDPFQLGASFVFGPGNADLFTHLSAFTGDNAPMASLISALP